jgi:hypothetical protein
MAAMRSSLPTSRTLSPLSAVVKSLLRDDVPLGHDVKASRPGERLS